MRKCGILLPISSLPGKYGIGCFSEEAYKFVDFLKEAGQHYWQILPLGPTSYGDSPYQSFSTFAGNPYYIDLSEFIWRGWLTEAECAVCENENNYVEYGELYETRYALLKEAFRYFKAGLAGEMLERKTEPASKENSSDSGGLKTVPTETVEVGIAASLAGSVSVAEKGLNVKNTAGVIEKVSAGNTAEAESHETPAVKAVESGNKKAVSPKQAAKDKPLLTEKEKKEWHKFLEDSRDWLPDYALFRAVKDIFEGKSWIEWPEDIRYRWDYALHYYRETCKEAIEFYEFLQFMFQKQWKALKAYANAQGVEIIGDIPIYVAYDSADVWSHPELFQLAAGSVPAAVAGCPPDGFSPTGQLWGNPLYRWDFHKQTGYAWWVARMKHCFSLFDVVRIDHFRGFESYYAIPFGDETAEFGHWEKGPGLDLFKAIERRHGKKRIIAEDLGYLTPEVRKMVKDSGYPGMKVLEFAFDARDSGGANDYLPHNYAQNAVVYTGTHDNETLMGWLGEITKEELTAVRRYLHRENAAKDVLCDELIRLAVSSVADTCIIPIQDWLHLGDESRINTPATLGNNWKWRLVGDELTDELAAKIRRMNLIYGRVQ